MDKDFKVDFIGVGFSRCGTTWIAKCLLDHPEICTPKWKEVHFFDYDYNYKKGLEFYKSFFKNSNNKIIGEYCPEYIFEEKALERIKSDFPDVKIIISLRNPIDRAFSHFLYAKRKNGTVDKFDELFKNDPKHIIEWSHYYKYIKNVYQYFDKKNVLIVIHDDYKNDPKKFIQCIYKFLGVDENFTSEFLLKEVNKSKNLKFRFDWFERLFSGRFKKKSYLFWRIVIKTLKLSGLDKVLIYLRGQNYIDGNHEEKEFLFKSDIERLKIIYKKDTEELEKLLNRDLSSWKYE